MWECLVQYNVDVENCKEIHNHQKEQAVQIWGSRQNDDDDDGDGDDDDDDDDDDGDDDDDDDDDHHDPLVPAPNYWPVYVAHVLNQCLLKKIVNITFKSYSWPISMNSSFNSIYQSMNPIGHLPIPIKDHHLLIPPEQPHHFPTSPAKM